MTLLSIIIPVYNEAKTVREILTKINSLSIDKEIIVVDDGSSDNTRQILKDIRRHDIKIIYHTRNRGKGAAFLTGLANSCGEFVIIQDADLEYDPNDYTTLIDVVRQGQADMAIGARFLRGHQGLFLHRLGNKFLTWVLNMLFGSDLNDYASCYKLARKATFERLGLKATGFDIEVEIICNALKNRLRIAEVPVSYFPRSYKEGKKIRFNDAFWALFYMFKCRLKGA